MKRLLFNQTTFCLLFFLFLCSGIIHGQVLVADINQDNQDSDPENLASNGEVLIFTANGDEGNQLYRVKKGENQPKPLLSLAEMGSRLWASQLIDSSFYFLTGRGDSCYYHQVNIFTESYQLLAALPGNPSQGSGDFTKAGNTVFFIHRTNFGEFQLWGIPQSTQVPVQLGILPNNSFPEIYFAFKEEIIFGFTTEFIAEKSQIWKSDGTPEGTVELFNPDPTGSPNNYGNFNFQLLGDYFYFTAFSPEYGYEIWRSDGTRQGTDLYLDYNSGTANGVFRLKQLGDLLYFIPSDTIPGVQIYQLDPEQDSIRLFFDQNTIPEANFNEDFFDAAGSIYLVTRGFSSQRALWRVSESNDTIVKIKDDVLYRRFGNSPPLVQEIGGTLYFLANHEEFGHELWKTDGTAEGTSLVEDIYKGGDASGINDLVAFDGRLFFSALSADYGRELWSSNHETGNTSLVEDLNSNESGDSYPGRFFEYDSTLFFSAYINCLGRELYRTLGTPSTTRLFKDISPGKRSADPYGFLTFKDQLYFTAQDGNGQQPFWVSDGTAEGTQLALYSDINFPTLNTYSPPFPLGDRLIIRSMVRDTGLSILSSDGTQEGTNIIKVISSGGATGTGIRFVPIVADSLLAFEAADEELGNSIWRTDGTTDGTYILKSFPGSSSIGGLTPHNGLVFFRVDYFASNQAYWWRTDGTVEGTFQISVFSGEADELVPYENEVYFTHRYPGGGAMFKSDGSRGNTVQVPFDVEGSRLQTISRLQVYKDKIYFYGDDGTHGYEPWVYDLIESKWSLLKDINPGSADGGLGARFYPIGDYLCFFAMDDQHGRELWQTDGTSENTVLVKDLTPGPQSSISSTMYPYQGFLYFSGNGGAEFGYELYKYSPYDKDDDGYLPDVDADDNDPLVNVDEIEDPTAIAVTCSVDSTVTNIYALLDLTQITVFPNPTSDYIRVEIDDHQAYEVHLISPLGQRFKLGTRLVESTTYDLSKYPAGSYYLLISNREGKKVGLKQIHKF